jgi:hypothetical protein
MDLPRFTTGNLGRLTFKDVNTLCDVAERAEEFLRTTTSKPAPESARNDIFAYVVGRVGEEQSVSIGAMEFYEVELENLAGITFPHRWIRKLHGIETGAQTIDGQPNPNFTPCFSLARKDPTHLPNYVGMARLRWLRTTTGRGYWFIVYNHQRTSPFPALITAKTRIGESDRWRYHWTEVQLAADGISYEPFYGGADGGSSGAPPEGSDYYGSALNGAEFATYPTVVGNARVTREPIGAEVVTMILDKNQKPFFHARNDYKIVCIPA